MTRSLFLVAALLCLAMFGALIVGLTSSAPALLMVAMLLCGPAFMFTLGAAIGRASNEFAIVRKDSGAVSIGGTINGQRARSRLPRSAEPLS